MQSNRGFSLLELGIAVTLLVFVSVFIGGIIQNFTTSTDQYQRYALSQMLVKQKLAEIESLGFWALSVDTLNPQFSGNSQDPAVQWKLLLDSYGLQQGLITVQFMRDVSGTLTAFSGDFEGDSPRDVVLVSVSIVDSQSRVPVVMDSILLSMYPTPAKTRAVIHILRQALTMYYVQYSYYPSSGSLSSLVNTVLKEIPNDPYTVEQSKFTHTEESSDWLYTHDSVSNQVTLSSIAQPSITLSWTY